MRGVPTSIVLIATAVLAIHLLASLPGTSWMWGAHFYSFFPIQFLYGATFLVVAVTLLLSLREQAITTKITNVLSRGLAGRRLWVFAAFAVAAGTFAFWMFRICHAYLGDGSVLLQEIDKTNKLLYREPLTSVLQHAVFGITKAWFSAPGRSSDAIAQDALAVGSVAAGGLFLAGAWLLADELSRLRASQESAGDRRPLVLLLWLVLVTQGYMQLFFGYIENYSFHAAGVVFFLWLSLRYLRGACGLLWPALALCLCVALHLSSMLMGIPFLVLVAVGLRTPERRRAALRDLAVWGLAVAVTLAFVLRKYNPLATLLDMFRTAFADRHSSAYMFSRVHLRDFFNEQILIGPLGMFLFVLAAVITVLLFRRTRHRTTMFSLAAGLTVLAACWMMKDSNLGYARDWDLLSHTGIVFTTAGLALLLVQRVQRSALVAALIVAVLVSVFHTAPWIATNANEVRSLARLATLPLDRGRTEVMMAWWYNRKGDDTRERAWLQRATVVYRGNSSAYYFLGVLDMKQRAYNDAIASFRHTVALRPDKIEFRGRLAYAYFLADRFSEATPDLQFIVDQEPGNTMAVFYLGESLQQAGRLNDAAQMFLRAEPLCLAATAERPRDSAAAATYGWVLFRLGRDDESLTTLTRADALDPPAPVTSCYMGYVLHELGRDDEARERFTTCLGADSDLPERNRVEAWLCGVGPPPQE